MFCRNCGNALQEDAKFCPHCGQQEQHTTSAVTLSLDFEAIYRKLRNMIEKYSCSGIIRTLSISTVVINILIRLFSNEILTVYYGLAQDDYYAITHSGKTWIFVTSALYTVLITSLLWLCKKKQIVVERKPWVSFAITLFISLMAIFVRIPAPY